MVSIRWRDRWRILIQLPLVLLITIIAAIYLPFTLTDETEFWLFSTISQSVAALFGFIFAGYAFFRSEVTLDDVDDPEAREILTRLHSKAHIRLANTAIPAGLAIIGGFSTTALIKEATIPVLGNVQNFLPIIETFTFYQAVIAVILSILFVIHIASPNRTRQVVNEILEEESLAGKDVDVGEFTKEFIRFENILRDLYYEKGGKDERATAGQIIDYLEGSDVLEEFVIDRLREITRYRNLVIHGEINSVDREAYDELDNIITKFNEIYD